MALEAQTLDRSSQLVSNAQAEAIPSASELECGGARWLNASTDDVLGLASDPRVREALSAAVRRYGAHRPLSTQAQRELEARLSELLGKPARVAGELGSVLRALPAARFAADARSAALLRGAALVKGPEEAEPLVRGGGIDALLVQAMFPLEGDLAPLPRYAELCERTRATLVTVDPMGLGALGATGGGATQHLAVAPSSGVSVSRLGAALPGMGTVIAGDPLLVEGLGGLADAPLAAPMAATVKALEVLAAEPQRRARMFDVAQSLLDGLRELAFDTGPAVTPWIPVWVGDAARCQRWLKALGENAIAVRASLAPGAARLLLALPATASDGQVTQLLEVLERTGRRLEVPRASSARPRIEVARPGSYATAAPCSPRWHSRPRGPADPEEDGAGASPAEAGLRDRVFDTVETLTWRAANVSGTSIRWTAEAIRALLDLRRKS